jgi:hypothetical protein
MWFSHKFKGPGVRYEIGLCIQTGWIVWKNGPYPCGSYPDLKIARHRVVHVLAQGEKILADGGYRDGGLYAETPSGYNTLGQRMKKVARSRHETVNARIKTFKVLSTAFKNKRENHWMCFHALANMIQLDIEEGRGLFQVHYDDNLFV